MKLILLLFFSSFAIIEANQEGGCLADAQTQAQLKKLREELRDTRTQLNEARKQNAKIQVQKRELEKQIADEERSRKSSNNIMPTCESMRDVRGLVESSYSMTDYVMKAEDDKKVQLKERRKELEKVIDDLKSKRGIYPTEEDKKGGIFSGAKTRADGLHLPTLEEYLQVLTYVNSSDALLEAWHEHMSLDRDEAPPTPSAIPVGMYCDIKYRSDKRPTSVHKLRPGDIDVVAALGDSVSAGFGAGADWYFLHEYVTEYRGVSWSGGGDGSYASGMSTLPNILKEFNPNLKGFSVGKVQFWQDPKEVEETNLNVAITGSVASDLQEQVDRLVMKMKKDPEIDFEKDWKMVTIFIGANDLCDYCNDAKEYTPSLLKTRVGKTLDTLYEEVPRVFVNLVEIFDIAPVTQLATYQWGRIICSLLVNLVKACPCSRVKNPDTKLMSKMSREYQKAIQEIVADEKYKGREDFAVVDQPFYREITSPKTKEGEVDMTYFAQDCFHFSIKGQKKAGRALWNSIIEPVGKKRDRWDLMEPANCPTMEFLPTEKNSK